MTEALWGSAVNAAAIVAGGLAGLLLQRMSDGMRRTVMQGIGLALIALGVSMALKSDQFLLIAACLTLGGIAGELAGIERRLEGFGALLERGVNTLDRRFRRRSGGSPRQEGRLAAGFVNATLVFCIGAMAVLGALDSGLRGDHVVLYTKSLLDGFLSIIFASTMGVGVAFSALPVFLYQGLIALASSWIAAGLDPGLLDAMIVQITAVGGVLIIGVGINLLELRRIHVANLLPALVFAALAVPLAAWMSAWWTGL
ncbi:MULTISPECIES: DUF554 domain-containing protein [Paenibacillus]|uniref:DUF554 domain-containing protein n=1 Tax=Paenibacillus TaxID=44249 RepID=UPI0022B90A96|nr:DUF554 domain-containing protein [Paenibacillus caseinilyticus]MCZ8523250.1 DUF554 domain-containing protein [Paenibacillus caseinilyticus]